MIAYEADTVAWAEQQADALRRRASNEIDWDNLAEEIESLGRSERRELNSRVVNVLEHLMRLAASPAPEPRRGWADTVARERREIAALLADSPSLRPEVAGILERAQATARSLTARALERYGERPQVALEEVSFSVAEVLDAEFWP